MIREGVRRLGIGDLPLALEHSAIIYARRALLFLKGILLAAVLCLFIAGLILLVQWGWLWNKQILLGSALLIGIVFSVAVLLTSTWTIQAGRREFRQQAQERRRLDAEWQAVQCAEHSVQPGWCPRCGDLSSQKALYHAVEDKLEDDD